MMIFLRKSKLSKLALFSVEKKYCSLNLITLGSKNCKQAFAITGNNSIKASEPFRDGLKDYCPAA